MQNPLNSVTANELVERYIGTAYDNVKAVAGDLAAINAVVANEANINLAASLSVNVDIIINNIDNINTVATDIGDVNTVAGDILVINTVAADTIPINTVAGDSAAINIVAGDTVPINALAGIEAEITAVNGALANVNTVGTNLSTTNTIGTVATNIVNVNTVGNNIDNVNTVAGVTGDMTAVIGNSVNINTVASNIDNVNDVGANIDAVIGVDTNEADISFVADNMPAITANAGIITMTAVQLELRLTTGAPVAGVSYDTLQGAYDYAKTVLQAGGHLILNVDKGITITDTAPVVIDLNRLDLTIQDSGIGVGAFGILNNSYNIASSIQYLFSGKGHLIITDIEFTTVHNSLSLLYIKNCSYFKLSNKISCIANSVNLISIDYSKGILNSIVVEAAGNSNLLLGIKKTELTIENSNLDIVGIERTGNGIIYADEQSKIFIDSIEVNASSISSTPIDILLEARKNSYIIAILTNPSIVFPGGPAYTTFAYPEVNTYAREYSRIVTV